MERILLADGLSKDIVTAAMMLYKNTKAMIRSADGDFFDVVAGILLGDTLAPYIFQIFLSYQEI